jgi:hypothetical protein
LEFGLKTGFEGFGNATSKTKNASPPTCHFVFRRSFILNIMLLVKFPHRSKQRLN